MIKAVGYCRFSSEHQTELSIDGQKRAIGYYAKENRYQITHYYCDRAVSGKSASRPEFQHMIEDIQQNKDFSAVLVYKLDRFCRITGDALKYETILNDNDVELISVMEKLDSSPTGTLMKTIIMGMNNFYVDNMAADVLRGMKEAALQCKMTGGIAPLGYRFVDQRYEIEESEAEIIRLIFDMVDAGCSYNNIIDKLNKRGHKTRQGNHFGKNSLYDILRNERYKGTFTFNKARKRRSNGSRAGHGACKPESEIIRIENGIPAIIDPNQWERVNKLMDSRKYQGRAGHAKEVYLLSGIIYCGECGHAMHGNSRYPAKNRDKVITYRCNYKDHNRRCDSHEIQRDSIEGYVIRQLECNLFCDDAIPRLTEQINQHIQNEMTEAERLALSYQERLQVLTASKDNIVTAIAQTGYESAFAEKLTEIEWESQTIQNTLQKLQRGKTYGKLNEDMVREYLASFHYSIENRDKATIKQFIRSFINRVEIYNDRIKVVFKVSFFFAKAGIRAELDAFTMESDRRLLKWLAGQKVG